MRLLIPLLFLSGCATVDPFLDMKFVYQHDAWSDWVLQSERPWTGKESEVRVHMTAGLETDVGELYFESIVSGPWSQAFVGYSYRFGNAKEGRDWNFFIEPALVHQIDNLSSEFLQTSQKQWQGHNPFVHLRIGLQGAGDAFRCPVIATGKSVFQGAPFESEDHAPDLYWTNVECGVRLFGRQSAAQIFSE
jgi:hypothetical protein